MTRSLPVLLALRNLGKRPLRAVLTMAGIVLGVAMVVAVLSLSATLLAGFNDMFDTVYGRTDLIVTRDVTGGPPAPFDQSILKRIQAVPGVDTAQTSGEVSGNLYLVDAAGKVKDGAANVISFGGFTPGKLAALSSYTVVAGRDMTRAGDFVVESGWAADRGFAVGSAFRAAASTGIQTFRITGLFRFTRPVNFGGTGFAAAPLADAQRLLSLEGRLVQVDVRVTDRARIEPLRVSVQKSLGTGFAVRTPAATVTALSDQLAGLNTFLLFFAGVTLFVGAFLIFNAFNVAVLQRTREIGMMRALGATRGAVVRNVMAEASAMGLVGALLGLGAGVGLAIGLIALLGSIAVGIPLGSLTVPTSALVTGVLVGVVVTMLAALYPALRASRVSPLEAMRSRAERLGRTPWRAAVVGALVVGASAPGVWLLTSADPSTVESIYGVAGVVGVFLGVSLAAPLLAGPLVRALSAPLRLSGRVEGRLASDNASRAPARTGLTASAVMIGLALVVTFSCFSASAISAVRDTIDRSLRSDFIVGPRNNFAAEGFSPALAGRIAALPEARAVSAVSVGVARAHGGTTMLVGVDPTTIGRVSGQTLADGTQPDWTLLDGPSTFLTRPLASSRHLVVGDAMTLIDQRGAAEPLRVAGVIDDPEPQAYISARRAAQDFGVTRSSQVFVTAADNPAARTALQQALERVVASYPSAKVLSNTELKNDIEAQFNQIFGFLYALLGVGIVASALGIANTMLMSVLERTREIGLIRAIGGTRRQLRGMIRRESILITLVGVVLGLVVGLALGYVFVRASASQFPGLGFVVPWTTILVLVLGALVVAVVAAIMPARRATRINVLRAVGFE